MSQTKIFKTKLRRPADLAKSKTNWAYVVLPKNVSDILPRRGRTTVDVHIGKIHFQATLEPDGQLSHWLKIDENIYTAAGATIGDEISLKIAPVKQEPEPEVPADLMSALAAAPAAFSAWQASTTLARLDWIHWITTAKQAKTRAQRISNACDMLASGKKRVCCFDPSGYYSKALSAPREAD